jgi:hypothetical protein
MPSYDAMHFDPPAPVAQVILRNPHSGATVSDVPLLVDTGADITLLPRYYALPLVYIGPHEIGTLSWRWQESVWWRFSKPPQ